MKENGALKKSSLLGKFILNSLNAPDWYTSPLGFALIEYIRLEEKRTLTHALMNSYALLNSWNQELVWSLMSYLTKRNSSLLNSRREQARK